MNARLAARAVLPVVIALAILGAGLYLLVNKGNQNTLTADFPRTVSIYQGSDVRVLGVTVGKVEKVEPEGTDVVVTMRYDKDVQIPKDAKAVIVAPSVVGDRYIQLTPAYTSGPTLPNDATLGENRTAVPLELDDIYGSIDTLVKALGPNGANKNGALTDLLQQTANNLGGQGQKLHNTIESVGRLTQTLADNKNAIFGSARQLETFVHTLAKHDGTVRRFTTSLDQVSAELAGERSDLSSALRNLSTALGNVATFVKSNKHLLRTNITGLKNVLSVVVKQRDALNETLKVAPLALNNLYLTYDPEAGTLNSNANLTEIGDQIVNSPGTFLCGILGQATNGGTLCKLIETLLPKGTALGQGTGSSYDVRTDPTLGGLASSGGGR